MNANELARIRTDPAFMELERKRNSFSWTLAVVMFVIYMGFIFLVAFDHSIVAQPIGSGTLTLAFPLGLGVIIVAIVLTGVYVVRANTEFERLTQEVVSHSQGTTPARVLNPQLAGGVR